MASAFDLHTHSTASDGTLSPSDLVAEASEEGIGVLALTDHDTTAGVPEAQRAALKARTIVIPGVEVSVTWNRRLLHVVGLNVDVEHPLLIKGLGDLQAARTIRAEEIGRRLENLGVKNAYEGARQLAGQGQVTRTHFARFLVQSGYALDFRDAFKKALGRGRPAYVSTTWAKLDEAVAWIRASGGEAVLAHPMRYRFSAAWMRRMLKAFKDSGGTGVEVACGSNSKTETTVSAEYAVRFGLLGSVGSDYHGPDSPRARLGNPGDLPPQVTPIWKGWNGTLTELPHA